MNTKSMVELLDGVDTGGDPDGRGVWSHRSREQLSRCRGDQDRLGAKLRHLRQFVQLFELQVPSPHATTGAITKVSPAGMRSSVSISAVELTV